MKTYNLILNIFSIFILISCGKTTSNTNEEKMTNEETAQTEETSSSKKKTILFYGNSLTAGYGLEDLSQTYTSLIQNRIDSLGLNYQVVNAGLSGETTAGGASRIEWVLQQEVDVFVLELGGNDGLRGISTDETRKNLQKIIDAVKAQNANCEIILAGMQIPPNMGQEYTSEFRKIYPEVAEANNIGLIPFLLEGVAGIPELMQSDGVHPTAEGQVIMANTVWESIKDLL